MEHSQTSAEKRDRDSYEQITGASEDQVEASKDQVVACLMAKLESLGFEWGPLRAEGASLRTLRANLGPVRSQVAVIEG